MNSDDVLPPSGDSSPTEEIVEQTGLLEEFPDLKGATIKETAIVLMYAAGVNRDAIAEFAGCARSTVFEIAKRFGVSRFVNKAVYIQRTMICNALGSMMVEALLRANAQTHKMRNDSPTELVEFAKTCADLYMKVLPRMRKAGERTESLIESLK